MIGEMTIHRLEQGDVIARMENFQELGGVNCHMNECLIDRVLLEPPRMDFPEDTRHRMEPIKSAYDPDPLDFLPKQDLNVKPLKQEEDYHFSQPVRPTPRDFYDPLDNSGRKGKW
jgi:hypothetical protein